MTIRLLYVEDDDDLRRLLSVMLVNEGYEVVAVSSAEDAIVELQTRHYQLLLTDYNLENKNADWMLQVAEGSGALRDTTVVILTGEVRPAGVDGYRILKKPVDVAVLFAALDDAVTTQVKLPLSAPAKNVAPDTPASVGLTLYVTGGSRESKKALRNLNRILRKFEHAQLRIDVLDVTDGTLPADALDQDRIVVTPTLVRTYPLPKVWVFGNLSKTELVEQMIAAGVEHLRAGAKAEPDSTATT
jgi:circadian clock protein KaiB